MSPVKRICVFEHSVMTKFNCTCPAIQKGQGPGFLSEGFSWLTACIRAVSPEPWLLAWAISTKFAWRGPDGHVETCMLPLTVLDPTWGTCGTWALCFSELPSHPSLSLWQLCLKMVLGSFQCRGVLLLWHMVGQGPAVLAAGAGWVGYVLFFFFKSRVSYLPFLMPHLLR